MIDLMTNYSIHPKQSLSAVIHSLKTSNHEHINSKQLSLTVKN